MNLLLVQSLPKDIINKIISYTYQPQNPILINDIQHYHLSKYNIYKLYYNKWILKHKQWIPSDTLWFCYELKKFITNHYYLYKKVNIKYINNYNYIYTSLRNKEDINILWGTLTPQERNIFISIHFSNIELNNL